MEEEEQHQPDLTMIEHSFNDTPHNQYDAYRLMDERYQNQKPHGKKTYQKRNSTLRSSSSGYRKDLFDEFQTNFGGLKNDFGGFKTDFGGFKTDFGTPSTIPQPSSTLDSELGLDVDVRFTPTQMTPEQIVPFFDI